MPRIVETFDEFKQRQGCPFVVSNKSSPLTGDTVSRVVFENGSVSVGGQHFDPSPDRHTLLITQLEYVELKLTQEEQAWKNYKQATLEQAANHQRFPRACPPPPPEAPALLKAGAERIVALRQRYDALRAQLLDPEEERRRRETELSIAHQEQLASKVLAEITVIELPPHASQQRTQRQMI